MGVMERYEPEQEVNFEKWPISFSSTLQMDRERDEGAFTPVPLTAIHQSS